MNRNAWIILVIGLLFIGGMYVYSRSGSENNFSNTASSSAPTTTAPEIITATTTPANILAYGRRDVRLNERLVYPDGSIKILSVDEDSRCATGVQCIWAGTVKTSLEYSENGIIKKGTLELNKSITRGSEKITLVSVSPSPTVGKKISDSDYVFTIDVVKSLSVKIPVKNNATASGGCFIGGCSAQICSDQEGVASNCEYRESYACYKTAKCERQQNGQCGWTETSELKMCLANAG